jgi:NAD(P)-dependent dehydrogenase (short-subunit alcohol dehydrogenase family)
MTELTGRIALVTGASRGIGAAMAVAMAQAGADVAVMARNEELLERTADQIRGLGRRALVLPCDVTDAAAVKSSVTQAVLPHMLPSGNAAIINVSSVVALRGAPLMSHYAAAKAAVVSLTQSLALECASSGIRVNALLPGWIKTDLTEFLRGDEQTERSVLQRVPMQRWGTAEEIAAVAVFLASDAASFITGQSIVADGGLSVMP